MIMTSELFDLKHTAAAPLLEQCCRELGDYKMAYFYACKQKK